MEQNFKSLRLGSSGLRGVIGAGLSPGTAIDFAAAMATVCSGGRILVGCDSRSSSASLTMAVKAGLCGGGAQVIDGGLLPCGLLHYLIPKLGLDGGVLITGGHQMPGWNSLIPFGANGAYFNQIRQRELFDVYQGRTFAYAKVSELQPGLKLGETEYQKYFDYLDSLIDAAAIRQAHFKIIADFCNGAGGVLAEQWAKWLGVDLVAINAEPNGRIGRNPEPRPRSGSPLAEIIKPLRAQIGLVFNSDLSRLEVITDNGEPLSEELTFPLALDYFFAKQSGNATVVSNVCSTRTVDDLVQKYQGTLEKANAGQAQVIDKMQTCGASIGGEGSGAFAFAPQLAGFDGLLMSAFLLEAMAKQQASSSELVAKLPRYHIVKMNFPCPSQRGYGILKRLHDESFAADNFSDQDGLRWDWESGWISVRISHTDQLMRIISEDRDKTVAQSRAEKLAAQLSEQ